jgi:hypothetical protein
LEAGSWKPEVLVKNVGFAKYLGTVVDTEILPTIMNVTPDTISPNGGMEIKIAGNIKISHHFFKVQDFR